jgi:alkyldihydroxyacetonephosphate synthase
VDLDALITALPQGAVLTATEDRRERVGDWSARSWLASLRRQDGPLPAAVVLPATTSHVAVVLEWADAHRVSVVARGGGSGVVGGAVPPADGIVLDMMNMSEVISIDETSMTVTVEAGVRGDRLEAALQAKNLTLGHYPQSLSLSTVGGWIASSAIGHASVGYGAIEDLVLGLEMVMPGGRIARMRAVPRSAAGPDLRRLLVGSEGSLGVITVATLSARRRESAYRWVAYELATFETAAALIRSIIQARLPVLIVRAYDPADAALTFGPFGFAGGAVVIGAFDDAVPGLNENLAAVERLARHCEAHRLPDGYGRQWHEHHTDAVDLYRKIMGPERIFGSGVAVDTLEVAGLWSSLGDLYASIATVLADHCEMSGCHLSHAYPSGASLYFTFLIRGSDDVDAEDRHRRCWTAVIAACHEAGGTMTHHHGVGLLKAPYMSEELGEEGLMVLRTIKHALDPHGIMNPGKLFSGP